MIKLEMIPLIKAIQRYASCVFCGRSAHVHNLDVRVIGPQEESRERTDGAIVCTDCLMQLAHLWVEQNMVDEEAQPVVD